MKFASDNAAGVAPGILDALTRANAGFALAYGDDDDTHRVERRFGEIFEREVAVFLVPTGTAANALALAHLTPVWGAVMCHREAHIIVNECGAPEFFGGGLRLVGLDGDGGKLAPATVALALDRHTGHSPHQVVPAMVSLTQATEAGTIYRTDEIAALASLAHQRGLGVHMDGARFANALVRLGVTPAQITWQAGVDVLSFGATKGGALAAEAIVVFDPAAADAMHERRKRGAHLVSKHRFIAAQFEAFFSGDLWLDLARHANRMADRLAAAVEALDLAPVWPVEANLVFVRLPQLLPTRACRPPARTYYARHSTSLPGGRRHARRRRRAGAAGHVVCDHRGRGRPLRAACHATDLLRCPSHAAIRDCHTGLWGGRAIRKTAVIVVTVDVVVNAQARLLAYVAGLACLGPVAAQAQYTAYMPAVSQEQIAVNVPPAGFAVADGLPGPARIRRDLSAPEPRPRPDGRRPTPATGRGLCGRLRVARSQRRCSVAESLSMPAPDAPSRYDPRGDCGCPTAPGGPPADVPVASQPEGAGRYTGRIFGAAQA